MTKSHSLGESASPPAPLVATRAGGVAVRARQPWAPSEDRRVVLAIQVAVGIAILVFWELAIQLELAELDRSRTLLMEAEVRALRAQISPHFIYNSLTTIASFVRTDPERARELLIEFADFTRYSFRRHGEFTTLAEDCARSSATCCSSRPASATGSGSRSTWPPRCWASPSRSCACSRWWRTPCATASRPPRASATSGSSPTTAAPSA